MEIYKVGGCVRDQLMGVQPKDIDYVVTGSSPEEMISLGYRQVGADFPVFLHPDTGEEYALARTERKTGEGYNGFTCEWEGVTLEEDLSRRDLTINSIAMRDTGEIIDPFNGEQDIRDKVLRHTSEAFKEDPLRVLRVARFVARFDEYWVDGSNHWVVADETSTLITSMDITQLTPERVWLEINKVLYELNPSIFFGEISDWHAGFFPEYDNCWDTDQREDHHPEGNVGMHTGMVMDYAAKIWHDPEINFACLTHDWGKPSCWKEFGNAIRAARINAIREVYNKWKIKT